MAGVFDQTAAPQYVTRDEIGSILDAWYAKKQPLQQDKAAPNASVYTPSYGESSTQQAAGTSTQQTPGSQPQQPQPQQTYGWRPQSYGQMYNGYGMQTPFSGYGMGYGGYGGMGGYGSYMNSYSPFGGGFGYGQMYNPFSMY